MMTLGNSVKWELRDSVNMLINNSLWDTVKVSSSDSVWFSASDSVSNLIRNSTRWNIKLRH